MTHLDEGEIQAYLDGELSRAERVRVVEHLVACVTCRGAHDELREVGSVVAGALPLLDDGSAPRLDRAPAAAAAAGARSAPARHIGPLVRAAVLVLVVAAAASAAVPGSPIREWILRTEPEASAPEPEVAVETPPVRMRSARPAAPPTAPPVAPAAAAPPEERLDEFEPFRVAYTLPALLNGDEVTASITRAYPPDLARDGLGGEAVLLLWLDEEGRVARSVVSSSSGHPALDDIALEVAAEMRFRPARNREQAMRVVVQIPVVFRPETGETGTD